MVVVVAVAVAAAVVGGAGGFVVVDVVFCGQIFRNQARLREDTMHMKPSNQNYSCYKMNILRGKKINQMVAMKKLIVVK